MRREDLDNNTLIYVESNEGPYVACTNKHGNRLWYSASTTMFTLWALCRSYELKPSANGLLSVKRYYNTFKYNFKDVKFTPELQIRIEN